MVEDCCISRFHTELSKVFNNFNEFLFPLLTCIIFVQSDISGPILSKNFHLKECWLSIANTRLITSFIKHHFSLDKKCFSHPLDIFSEISIKLILLFDKSESVDEHRVVGVDHWPCNWANHEAESFTWGAHFYNVGWAKFNHSFLDHKCNKFIKKLRIVVS